MTSERITMLGTGEAVTTRCYNTCFTLHVQNTTLLVDGGGGNGILCQLEKAGIALDELDAMFVSHAHTDHILGAVWIIRMMGHSRNAAFLHVKNLILYHTEDTDLALRRERYAAEAGELFKGNIYVPDDLEVIPLLPQNISRRIRK